MGGIGIAGIIIFVLGMLTGHYVAFFCLCEDKPKSKKKTRLKKSRG